MAKVAEKQPIVDEISSYLTDASSVVVVDYRGLNVDQDTRLRKTLREAGIVYKVYKNTMIRFAIKDTPWSGIEPFLEGPNAIAITKGDATASARIIAKFAKEAPALELRAGIVDSTLYDAKGITAIANIAPKEELLSKLLGSFKSPMTNFARVIQQIAEKNGGGAPAAQEAATEPAAPETLTAEPAAEAAPVAETTEPVTQTEPAAEETAETTAE